MLPVIIYSFVSSLSGDYCRPSSQSWRNELSQVFNNSTLSVGDYKATRRQVNETIPILRDIPILPRGIAHQGTWTGININFYAVKRVADAKTITEMIERIENEFGVRVVVASGNKTRNRKPKNTLESNLSAGRQGEFVDFLNDSTHANPELSKFLNRSLSDQKLAYYQSLFEKDEFEDQSAVFIAPGQSFPGANDQQTRPLRDQGIIVLKDFATRETLLHEFTHYQIFKERAQRNIPNPWHNNKTNEQEFLLDSDLLSNPEETVRQRLQHFNRAFDRIGEELDVHQFISTYHRPLGITLHEKKSSDQGFHDHLAGSNNNKSADAMISHMKREYEIMSKVLDGHPRKSHIVAPFKSRISELENKYDQSNRWLTNGASR